MSAYGEIRQKVSIQLQQLDSRLYPLSQGHLAVLHVTLSTIPLALAEYLQHVFNAVVSSGKSIGLSPPLSGLNRLLMAEHIRKRTNWT